MTGKQSKQQPAEFPQYHVVNTADLVPYARNARTHSEEQVDQIAASIREFAFLNPIITDGDHGIVAGHARVMAAQKLGMEKLPAISGEHLTEAQKRAYILADNKLALNAGWDMELLSIELSELKDHEFDLQHMPASIGIIRAVYPLVAVCSLARGKMDDS